MSFRVELPADMPANIMLDFILPKTERLPIRRTLTVWKDRRLSRPAVQASSVLRHYCICQDAATTRNNMR